jgi:hypothetical protein
MSCARLEALTIQYPGFQIIEMLPQWLDSLRGSLRTLRFEVAAFDVSVHLRLLILCLSIIATRSLPQSWTHLLRLCTALPRSL